MAVLHGKNYGKPSLDLNFAGNKSLIDTITRANYVTFSRAQSGNEATYVGSDGLIKYASADEPRFDHDPETGESLGLLVEESRTNYLSMFASPSYNSSNSATYSAYSDSRFGADQNAHSWTYASAQTNVELGWINPGSINTTGNGVQYTVSGWIKANQAYALRGNLIDERRQGINLDLDLTTEWQYFSLSTPAGINDDGSGTVYFRWIRGNIAIPAGLRLDFAAINLERGGFPTSYIHTSGVVATRAADVASITGTNFSNFYNNTEGTWFTDMALGFTQNAGNPFTFGGVYYTAVVNNFRTLGNQSIMGGLSNSQTIPSKTAVALKSQDFKVYRGGTQAGSNNSLSYTPTGTKWEINSSLGSLGRIKRVTYWPKRLPDIELQQLTK